MTPQQIQKEIQNIVKKDIKELEKRIMKAWEDNMMKASADSRVLTGLLRNSYRNPVDIKRTRVLPDYADKSKGNQKKAGKTNSEVFDELLYRLDKQFSELE